MRSREAKHRQGCTRRGSRTELSTLLAWTYGIGLLDAETGVVLVSLGRTKTSRRSLRRINPEDIVLSCPCRERTACAPSQSITASLVEAKHTNNICLKIDLRVNERSIKSTRLQIDALNIAGVEERSSHLTPRHSLPDRSTRLSDDPERSLICGTV